MWLYIHLRHWRVTKGLLCVNKQHSSGHSGPRCCSREIFSRWADWPNAECLQQGRFMKIYFILAAEGLTRKCSPQRSYTDWLVSLESFTAFLPQITSCKVLLCPITLQTNAINYLFHKHTLLVYVLLSFLKFKHLAQECNLSTLPFMSP